MPYKGFTEAQAKAHKKYMEGVATIQVRTTEEERERIKTAANRAGESVNVYIKTSVRQRMEREECQSVPAIPGGPQPVPGAAWVGVAEDFNDGEKIEEGE